jgi:predicted adenylyl cyclase CyaB
MSKNIEVEVRSFIDEAQFSTIKEKLDQSAEFVKALEEVTVYFSGEKDLRMRRSGDEASVILKEGKIHDDYRREFEIGIKYEDFDSMTKLFDSLGYAVEIEWYRKRLEYKRDEVKLLLDETKGYGRILELEKMVEEGGETAAHAELTHTLQEFGITDPTSKEEFDKRYEYYKQNWKFLTR